MQSTSIKFLSLLLIVMGFLVNGCKNDPCEGISCSEPNGTCVDGACVCETGWQGANCETQSGPCANVDCNSPHGTCDNGTCNCESGYEGTNCETLIAEPFFGLYTVDEDCSGVDRNYQSQIEGLSTDAEMVLLTNFYRSSSFCYYDTELSGVVNGSTVTLTNQHIAGFCSLDITGTGVINTEGTEIIFNYTVTDNNDGGSTTTCTATFTKN